MLSIDQSDWKNKQADKLQVIEDFLYGRQMQGDISKTTSFKSDF